MEKNACAVRLLNAGNKCVIRLRDAGNRCMRRLLGLN